MTSIAAAAFIVAFMLAAAGMTRPRAAEGQASSKVARIGLLCATRCEGSGIDALRSGLRDLGWIEGRNLVIHAQAAGGQLDRLPALTRELVAVNPDLRSWRVG